jgi:hypothetical protein
MHWNKTDEQGNNSANAWNSTAPTASVFSVGSTYNSISSKDYIAYCWHSVEGYSKVGSYEGNGNVDGTFIYTGFRPAYFLIKNIDSANGWFIMDDKRNTYNVLDKSLDVQDNAAEGALEDQLDFL